MNTIHSRTDLINYLIQKIGAKNYLEIGIEDGINFSKIECNYKVGVDPDKNSRATHYMTSDLFFETNKERFDVIFVDGLHHCDQVYKDIINSLNILNKNGYLVCHDMNPPDEITQRVPRSQSSWTGDCWKAFVKLRLDTDFLKIRCVSICSGMGIISKGNPMTLTVPISVDPYGLDYQFLEKHRKELLNLISVEEFLQETEL